MAYDILQILGWKKLLGVIEKVSTGVPNPFPAQFFTIKKPCEFDSGSYTITRGTRTVAKRSPYGGAAHNRKLVEVGEQSVKLVHSFESIFIDPRVFMQLRQKDTYERDVKLSEIMRQVAEFTANFQNLRISMLASMLAKGAIYFDADGSLLPSSSGADVTVDYLVPANNQNQLNGIIDVSWSNPDADIPTQLSQLDEQSLQDTGKPIKVAFYGRKIPRYLAQNTFAAEYLARNPGANADYLNLKGERLGGRVPQGLFGLQWIPVNTSFFEDSSATNQTWFGVDQVTFTPEIDESWYELLEGSIPVPTTIDVIQNVESLDSNVRMAQGMFAYAQVSANPVNLSIYHGDTVLPMCKNGAAMYVSDVTL